jgi:hypothetical protein
MLKGIHHLPTLLLETLPNNIDIIDNKIQKNEIPKYASELNLIYAMIDKINDMIDKENAIMLINFNPYILSIILHFLKDHSLSIIIWCSFDFRFSN